MKLRTIANEFGPRFTVIDDDSYDGAPDAGPQLVGNGDTKEDARADFMQQWMAREAKRATDVTTNVWNSVMEKLFQREMK